jgi:3-oxoacyl-[acyl-carrier protein] reductase
MSEHVIVTGGSRGLGLAIVTQLLKKGYDVTSVARSTSPELLELRETHGSALELVQADITDIATLREVVRRASHRSGIFGLVNNAAVVESSLLVMASCEDVERMIAVNFQATVLLSRLVAKTMIPARCGVIVNISSVTARRALSGLAVYSASKCAIEGLTRALARELGPRGITVNAVAPGLLPTAMTAAISASDTRAAIKRTPLRRALTCQDVAGVVLFLLSPAAQMITGSVIPVDGGAGL